MCYNTNANEQAWTNKQTYNSLLVLANNNTRSIIYATQTVYNSNNNVFFPVGYTITEPIITNTTQEIEEWTFNTLSINCGSWDAQSTFYLHCDYEGYTFTINVTQYVTTSNGVAIINIPKTVLNESIVLRDGFQFSFGLQARQPNLQNLYVDLESYTMQLTAEQQEQINQDSDKQLMSDIKDEQQQTNEKLDNIQDTLTDTNIDNDVIDLPSDDTEFITEEGIDTIFDALYEAFITDEPLTINLPIPYTHKHITIEPMYVYNMLHNNGGDQLITIIKAYWWYVVSKFIILDITDKIIAIKEGKFEEIQDLNIKEEML